MDEVRLKRIEIDMQHLNRRVTDHDELHAKHDTRQDATDALLVAMKKTTDSHDEMANVAREVIDLLKQLIKYLSWVGVAAKWVSVVAVAFSATWHLIKWAMAKLWVFS
jgi:hypothetical protein